MAHADKPLLVRPLLYDALSGEFEPVSDPNGRKHTLGRLSVATASKGNKSYPGVHPGLVDYAYEPSWAPGVISTARFLRNGTSDSLELIALKLEHDDDTLRFNGIPVESPDDAKLVVVSGMGQAELPLILGPEIAEARIYVTGMANYFFNQTQ